MKTIRLDQVLTKDQLKRVEEIVQHPSAWGDKSRKELKDYLCSIREDLEKQDILPEYLAYALEYALHL